MVVVVENPREQQTKTASEITPEKIAKAISLSTSDPDFPAKFRPDSKGMVERILSIAPSDPDPLENPFEKDYKAVSRGSSDLYDYFMKYCVAKALIEDGRYKDVRFLAEVFAPKNGQLPPEVESLKQNLNLLVRRTLIDRKDPVMIRTAQKELKQFAVEVTEGKTIDSQIFRKLVGIFGSSRAIDLLYRTRPEFRGIPVENVKGILADYLGDFLITKGPFNPGDVEEGVGYLSEPNLEDGLFEIIKDNCLSSYNFSKKSGSRLSDQQIFSEYFDIFELETKDFATPELNGLLVKLRNYFDSLFQIQKPAALVDQLREGRRFPDVNQLINIKELMDKKRVLIADDMGLGKSASAILAKETLGLKQAVIIAPSNVISTWQKYLSDDAEQGGYFRNGQGPKVLIVESVEALQGQDASSYQYILISQERMTDDYTEALLGLNFDMLIVDEIHKLKNLQGGVRSGNLVRLAEKVKGEDKYTALLSGTPVPNKIHDVAIILKLLYPERFAAVKDQDLIASIINGDIVDLRNLLVPRMQMKSLTESLQMPDLYEELVQTDFSELEERAYEVLMEEDELTASEKMIILRQFLLNPESLDATPNIPSSKISALQERLNRAFQSKDKVIMFVNDYVEGVIRGEKTIFDALELPEDVEVHKIMGGVSQREREAIQRDLNTSSKKMFVVVNGQTADVGVDFSGAEAVIFYNEPWTAYDKRQQLGRVYREGLKHPVESVTFVTRDTIEEGIHRYIEVKQKAIEKLLKGIPISDLEKELLRKTENQPDQQALEVNRELAEYYFSAWDRMMKIFRYTREIGERDFNKFLTDYGREYAECYTDLGSRSYQANASRIAGSLIDTFVREKGQIAEGLRILDIASGPEMLKNHIADSYRDRVISLDINRHHFEGQEGGKRIVASFLSLPFGEKTFDYANLSLAWHYTGFAPSKGNYERLEVLAQANRILKEGGRLVITNIYGVDLRDEEKFKETVQALGFRIVGHYTTEVAVGDTFKAHVYTLQKETDLSSEVLGDPEKLGELVGRENFQGVKFKNANARVRDSRKIITDFSINGTSIAIRFNRQDGEVLREERSITDLAELLKLRHGSINSIPREEVLANNFVRIKVGNRYVLFRKLEKGPGVVVIK